MPTWAVVHRIGRHRVVRLVIENVPGSVTTPARMRKALTAAGFAARFSESGIPWGNHSIVREDKWTDSDAEQAARSDVRRISWGDVERVASNRALQRRISARVEPELHAELTLAAERAGMSLNAYVMGVLRAAVERETSAA